MSMAWIDNLNRNNNSNHQHWGNHNSLRIIHLFSRTSLLLHFNLKISFSNNLFQLLHNKDHSLHQHPQSQQLHLLIRISTHITVLNFLNLLLPNILSQLSSNLLKIINHQDNSHLRNIDNLEIHPINSYLLRYILNINSNHLHKELNAKIIIRSQFLLLPLVLF